MIFGKLQTKIYWLSRQVRKIVTWISAIVCIWLSCCFTLWFPNLLIWFWGSRWFLLNNNFRAFPTTTFTAFINSFWRCAVKPANTAAECFLFNSFHSQSESVVEPDGYYHSNMDTCKIFDYIKKLLLYQITCHQEVRRAWFLAYILGLGLKHMWIVGSFQHSSLWNRCLL